MSKLITVKITVNYGILCQAIMLSKNIALLDWNLISEGVLLTFFLNKPGPLKYFFFLLTYEF